MIKFSSIAVQRSIFMGVQTMVLDLMSSESCKDRIRNLVCLSCFQYVICALTISESGLVFLR